MVHGLSATSADYHLPERAAYRRPLVPLPLRQHRLRLVPRLLLDERLMRVLKHHSIFLRRQGAFGLVGGLRGFEIHSLSKVLRHAKDFDYRFAPPMIQITVRSPSAASVAHAELRKIHARCDALLIAQDDRYAIWICALRRQREDTLHSLRRMGLDDPAILALIFW